jgi:hypothetical protein
MRVATQRSGSVRSVKQGAGTGAGAGAGAHRVAAALAELHGEVAQGGQRGGASAGEKRADVLLIQRLVVLALEHRELHPDDDLLLLGQRLHVLLHAPQQNGPQRLLHTVVSLHTAPHAARRAAALTHYCAEWHGWHRWQRLACNVDAPHLPGRGSPRADVTRGRCTSQI